MYWNSAKWMILVILIFSCSKTIEVPNNKVAVIVF